MARVEEMKMFEKQMKLLSCCLVRFMFKSFSLNDDWMHSCVMTS